MPLKDFISEMVKLVKAGQWTKYKAAVARRIKYFEEHPTEGTF